MARGAKLARQHRTRLKNTDSSKLSGKDKVNFLLELGTLAPSTHNTQPWLIKKLSDKRVSIYADFDKAIPEADPTGRDLFISNGAFLANVRLAALALGGTVKEKLGVNPQDGEIAELEFDNLDNLENPKHNPLVDALIWRQNYRGFFRRQAPSTIETKQLANDLSDNQVLLEVYGDKKTIFRLGELTVEGLTLAYADPNFRKEISTYINHNKSGKKHGLHGYTLRMNLRQSVIVPQIMKRKDIGQKLGEMNIKSFLSAPLVIVLWSKDNEESWIEVGKRLEEASIRLRKIGVATSIYAAAIEMGDIRKLVHEELGHRGELIPQLIVCAGRPIDEVEYSVRKPLSAFII